MNDILSLLLPFGVLILLFYFLAIRPQAKAQKKRVEMMDALKAGDKVETTARVFGEIISIDGDNVILQIGEGSSTKIKMHRDGVARVVDKKAKSLDA